MEQIYFDSRFSLGGRTVTVAITNHFLDETFYQPLRFHSHAGYEVQLIHSGSGMLQVCGERYAVEAGDLVLVQPECRHKMELESQSTMTRITFLFFVSGDKSNDPQSRYIWDAFEEAPPFLKAPNMADKLPEVAVLQRELQKQGSCYLIRVKAMLQSLFISMARAFSRVSETQICPVNTDEDKNRAQQIEDYLHNDIFRDMTCAEMARKLNISQRQLERILQNLYKKNFRTLRLELRMDTANALLDEGKLSMEAISESLGYSSVPAFYAAYRKFYGYTPGSRKKQNQN